MANSEFETIPLPKERYTDVVYVVAPTQRSGTNFLGQIVQTTGDFFIPNLVSEAYLFKQSPQLAKYANQTVEQHSNTMFWDEWIQEHESDLAPYKKLMMNEIGEGLLRYCKRFKPEDKRLLLKVPHSEHIHNFFHLFPNAKLLLLVRDGRDVLESTMRSWPERDFKHECKKWGWRARLIADFMEAHREEENKRWTFVHYEDLINDIIPTAERIFHFIGVPKENWDHKALKDIPIIGSSTYRGEKKTESIHFTPVEKNQNENFVNRWESWSAKQKRRFKRQAGEELIRLGFAEDDKW